MRDFLLGCEVYFGAVEEHDKSRRVAIAASYLCEERIISTRTQVQAAAQRLQELGVIQPPAEARPLVKARSYAEIKPSDRHTSPLRENSEVNT